MRFSIVDVAGDQAVDRLLSLLADAVGTVGGLIFDGEVPPGIGVDHISAAVRFRP